MDRFYKINVYYDGGFLFEPLRYVDSKLMTTITPRVTYDELVHFIETETGHPLSGLYYCVDGDALEYMLPLLSQKDADVFFDLMHSSYEVDVYVDYLSLNLSQYCYKNREGVGDGQEEGEWEGEWEGEGQSEGEKEDTSKTEHCETSRRGEMQDEWESEDDSYVPSEDSDVESVASLDHLSECEDEIREVRKGNPIAKIPTPNQLPDLGGKKQGEYEKTEALDEHEKFIKDLIELLTAKDDEFPNDPLQPPEPEVPKFPHYDTATHWRLRRPQVGQLFESHDQLRECLSYYALANGYSIWFERSCKDSIIARCGTRPGRQLKDPTKGKQRKNKRFPVTPQKCAFRCYARWMGAERSFQIKTLIDEHTCARNFKYGSLINYKWIGKHFAERIRSQPDIKLCTLQELVMKKYKCMVSHQQVKSAKTWALTEYEKTLEEHYALLRPYGEALLKTNPGSTVQLGVTNHPDGKCFFERFYVCLNGLKEGWKWGCRKVVALDGCFLKGSCNGEMLSAVGRDGNNQVYPIAWAIVNVENKENWTWFLSLLQNDLHCPDGDQLTLMSDQHKGLIGVSTMDPNQVGKTKGKMLKANAKVGFGKTMNWLSSGIGSSGMLLRDQERLTTLDGSISMTAPRGKKDGVLGTQESVNEEPKMKRGKNLGMLKTRMPSQRILRHKLGKMKPGPGQSEDDAITLE